MGSLKTLAVAGAVVLGAATSGLAGDLPPPPPPGPVFDAPLRGTVSSGLYLRGDIGVGIIKKDPGLEYRQAGAVLVAGPGQTFSFVDRTLDSNAFFGIGIGYQFNNWLRFDITGEYRTAARFGARDQLDTAGARVFDAPGTTSVRLTNQLNGSVSTALLMANAYADLGTFCALGCITPYIGAGIGVASHKFSAVTDISTTTPFIGAVAGPSNTFTDQFGSKTRTNLAWALMAGASVDVTRNVKLELGYRYINMGYAETGVLLGGQPPQTVLRVKDIDSHDFRLGMRWMLNGDCCAAPAPAPVFAPPPMVRKY